MEKRDNSRIQDLRKRNAEAMNKMGEVNPTGKSILLDEEHKARVKETMKRLDEAIQEYECIRRNREELLGLYSAQRLRKMLIVREMQEVLSEANAICKEINEKSKGISSNSKENIKELRKNREALNKLGKKVDKFCKRAKNKVKSKGRLTKDEIKRILEIEESYITMCENEEELTSAYDNYRYELDLLSIYIALSEGDIVLDIIYRRKENKND